MATRLLVLVSFVLPATLLIHPRADQTDRYFKITIVDDATGRGVPLVELRTTNELRYLSDSNGRVAVFEPGLMNQDVYFHVRSHGYEFPQDGFGFRGTRLKVVPGGSAVLKIKRVNIAERLYRVTGEGIYRDSVLLGEPVPLRQPVLAGQVTGQDSVHATVYRGQIFWIWGDTNRASYPLGNFGVSGAMSRLPTRDGAGGGLDPSVGVDLRYFTDEAGFSRAMVSAEAVPGPGPKWLGGLTTVRDDTGQERLIAKYVRVKSLGETLERGIVIFNDATESFERLAQFDLDEPLYLDGHPVRVRVRDARGEHEYLYCGYSPPYAVRVRADLKHITDPASHEGFTCLVAGTRYSGPASRLDRDPAGRLVWAWKRDTPPVSFDQQNELVAASKMRRDEAWLHLTDIETGKPVKPHAGSVSWNEFRQRWIMIFEQSFGTSALGEIYFAEADTPTGPWVYCRKIVTHDKYSFYNPTQHPFFDQDGGRYIFFEGTYSDLFSGSPEKTPRYDYNQIMYRLDLADPRLALPAAVYRVRGGGTARYLMREGVEAERAWEKLDSIAFFAVAAARGHEALVPVFAETAGGGVRLRRERPDDSAQPLFYALPASALAGPDASVTAPLLMPMVDSRSGRGLLPADATAEEQPEPACAVWRNPLGAPLLDTNAHPR